MVESCEICKTKIERTFLDKILGTTIKVKTKRVFICGDCQKKHKDNLKKEVEKLVD